MKASTRLDQANDFLDSGRRIGPIRAAAGRSGVALGFPRDPLLHISWIALALTGAMVIAIKLRRSRTRKDPSRLRRPW